MCDEILHRYWTEPVWLHQLTGQREAWCDCLDQVVVGDDMYYCLSCAQIDGTVFAVRRCRSGSLLVLGQRGTHGTRRDVWVS